MVTCSSTGNYRNLNQVFFFKIRLDNWTISYLTCRDKTEELKQLTPTERQELKNQDYARSSYSGTNSYDRMSRRRERALKIYVDQSPKKRDD